jgi:hypothetical protein
MTDDKSFIFSVDYSTIRRPKYQLDWAHVKLNSHLLLMGGGADIGIEY